MSVAAAVGQKYLFVVKSSVDGQQIRNTFWYQLSALTVGPSTDDIATSALALFNGVGGIIRKMELAAPGNQSFDSLSCQCIDPLRVRPVEIVIGTNGARGNCDAPGTALCYTRSGVLAGRKRQSVVHLVSSTDGADIVQGRPVLAQLTAVQNIANLNTLNINGIAPTYTLSPIIRNGAADAAVTLIERAFASDTVRTMRRRVVGRGI